MSRPFALAFTCLALLGIACPARAQEARFQLYLSWTEPEIDGEPNEIVRTIYLTLGKDGKVTEQVRRDGLGRRGPGLSQQGILGEDIEGRVKGRWKVVNAGTLVRLTAERSHTFAIWLTTDGKGSCSVRLEWRLKPGFKTYERWDPREQDTVEFGQPVVNRTSCSAF
ncbi:hypothetical protein [Bosea sp. (in: a-proteobacteria)]|uniref:hypothetical protein n=1 Tax=Bosea sp. (in: a-proteobacteria) TaxID=1871050 RepID=UPI0025C2B150|nr:hypothetical protein [Bosea sp. (in: a-proteobacteria)]MBR3191902.1 hypothetical protein [Bosea sp. (in: a-proteobacteria)]